MPLNGDLRKRWEERGLRGNRASSAAVLPPPPGYRRVYHLLSAEYAISNIVFARMKVARFSELNDPFELSALNLRNKSVRKVIDAHKQEMNRENGLLCFSADWADPVLWTHYGAQHTGICLGFDISEKIAMEISYQDVPLARRLEEDVTRIDSELAKTLLKTKFRSWAYEEEWRVLVNLTDSIQEGNLHFFPFKLGLQLKEVVLGPLCRLPVVQVRELTKTRHSDANVYGARLASGFFGIVPQEPTLEPDKT